jgi:hypothetical protein
MPDESRLVFLCELTLDTTSPQASGKTPHWDSFHRAGDRRLVRRSASEWDSGEWG